MSIRLYYSNLTERLAEKLAANLKDGLAGQDPFHSSTIIIPNKNLEQWLKMAIARRNAIATTLVFPFLEKGLWDLLASIDGRDASAKPALLGQDAAQLLVLSELLGIASDEKELALFREYLFDRKGGRQPDYYRKAWQLAGKLERVFREYEYNREELIDAWSAGAAYYREGSANLKRMEACQRALYNRVFGAGGSRDRLDAATGGKRLTLPQYERLIFRAGQVVPPPKRPGRTVHIFGLSQISAFHTRLLFELARHMDIIFYQLNVCSEFWEDMTTPQEDRYRKFKAIRIKKNSAGDFLEEHPRENRLLKLWGKPGRENVKLLSDLEEACAGTVEFDSEWNLDENAASKRPTVLRAVQDHIVHRVGKSDVRITQDASIQIAGAPGVYREVETVYNSIIENMRADPALQLTDIAVLVPDMATYKAALQAVFSREPRLVPYNLSDSAARDDSLYAAAVLGLLELIDSSYSRRQVFSLILNDCFLAACGATREDALVWLGWADKLNIFHSIDAEDRKRRGYGQSDLYTWRQGLERLRLGRIMETDDDPLSRGVFRRYQALVPFADRESANAALVSSFCGVVESLITRLADLQGAALSCAEWSARIGAVIGEFLAVPPARPEEEKVAASIRRAVGALSGCGDVLRQCGTETVGLAFVSEYLQAALAKVATTHGKYLSGGVTISSLLPMRPIPFRVAYIMGLGEGGFPGREDRSTLDLRHYRRRIGDVSTPEANRYLFLETLMSVREKLYLTYVSRDTQKDELFHPCSVVNELRGYLDDHILAAPFKTLKDADPPWPDDIPLKGSSARYVSGRDALPAWSDILQNFSVADRLACFLESGRDGMMPMTETARAACDAKARSLTAWKKLRGAQAAAPGETAPDRERIRLKELAAFLENPIEASLERHLGIVDVREEDMLAAEDEPFYSGYPENYDFSIRMAEAFIREWQAGGLARTDPARYIEERLGEWYGYCRLQGRTPDETFGGVDRRKFEAGLRARILGEKGLSAFLEARQGRTFAPLAVLGETGRHAGAGMRHDPLVLKIGPRGSPREAVVSGSAPFLWRDDGPGETELCIPVMRLPPKKGTILRQMLQPLLLYLSLRASGALGGKIAPCALYLAGPDKVVPASRYDVSRDDACEYLAMLVNDLLDPTSFDLLPLALLQSSDMAVETLAAKPKATESREFRLKLEELVTAAGETDYSAYRPSRIVAAIDAPVPKDAYEKAYRRITWLVKANTLSL